MPQLDIIDILHKVVNALPCAIVLFDAKGKFLYVNRGATDLFNYLPEEFDNLSIWDLILPEEKTHFNEHLKQLAAANELTFRNINLKRGGVRFAAEYTIKFLQVGNEQATMAIINTAALTDSKLLPHELPAANQNGPQAAAKTSTTEPATSLEMRPTRHNPMIMIIDDEHVSLTITGRFVKKMGFDYCCFDNSIDAMIYYENHYEDISLILLDMVMPLMDGPKTMKEIQSINPQAKVIACTDSSKNVTSSGDGPGNYAGNLIVPFTFQEIKQVISQVIPLPVAHDAR